MAEVDSAGSHVLLDYVDYERGREGDGEWVLGILRECVRESGVREVHSHVEIFDGMESPLGFAAAVLIDESHVTAHCYSERGLLAIDIFTCGASDSDSVADLIHERLVSENPGLRLVFRKNVERFRSG
jgi:S-adenosylmethionine decarboxylase|tara:strand:+ start:3666 stop:4049 length:384 start_codon:yes stop_codon:yes gene_type:complete